MPAIVGRFLEPARIPNPIRPKAVQNAQGQPGLNAETVLYAIDQDELGALQLTLGEIGEKGHGSVAGTGACERDELQKRLADSRPKWRKA